MTITLFDLIPTSTSSGPSFSPFCMRARLALLRKGVDFKVEYVTYEELRFGPWRERCKTDHPTAPIIQKEDGSYLMDSTEIALWLDRTYPEGPNLFLPEAPTPVDLDCQEYKTACETFEKVLRDAANPPETLQAEGIRRRGPFWISIFFLYARRVNSLFDDKTKEYWIDDGRLGEGTWKSILQTDEDEAIMNIRQGCKKLSDRFLMDSKLFFTSSSQPGMVDFALMGDLQLLHSVSPKLYQTCFFAPPSSTTASTPYVQGDGKEIDVGNFPDWIRRMEEAFPSLKEEVWKRNVEAEKCRE